MVVLHGHTHKGSVYDEIDDISIGNIGVVCKSRCGIMKIEKTDSWKLNELLTIDFSNLDDPIIQSVYTK